MVKGFIGTVLVWSLLGLSGPALAQSLAMAEEIAGPMTPAEALDGQWQLFRDNELIGEVDFVVNARRSEAAVDFFAVIRRIEGGGTVPHGMAAGDLLLKDGVFGETPRVLFASLRRYSDEAEKSAPLQTPSCEQANRRYTRLNVPFAGASYGEAINLSFTELFRCSTDGDTARINLVLRRSDDYIVAVRTRDAERIDCGLTNSLSTAPRDMLANRAALKLPNAMCETSVR